MVKYAYKYEEKRILFINPEMTYSGSPKSLLRMCKIAAQLGYTVTVWSEMDGPFRQEFERIGFGVKIIPGEDATLKSTIEELKTHDLAICNTIIVDRFVRICCRYIPTVWYIREATNIPYFTKYNQNRLYTLKNSLDLYCVSNYAAQAIKQYTKHKVRVVKNCVEDESSRSTSYVVGSSERVHFFQAGTLEYRKGLDILLDAYDQMPDTYKDRSDVAFAGRLLDAEMEFGSQLIEKARKISGVSYLGELVGRDFIPKMSEMDVVVVPSRDEACSLVALEAAMLSKPIVVTRNVGAKYIVDNQNGIIVNTGEVTSLKDALMKMIDNKMTLNVMGIRSREKYEEMAGMKVYKKEMGKLFERCGEKGSLTFRIKCIRNYIMTSDKLRKIRMFQNSREKQK